MAKAPHSKDISNSKQLINDDEIFGMEANDFKAPKD
jgi:hypothetical protein